MAYPYRRRRQSWQTASPKKDAKAKPQMVFTGIRLDTNFDRYMRGVWIAPDLLDLSQLVAVLYYSNDRILIVPAKEADRDSGQIFGKQRFNRGDKVVWQMPNSSYCIYTTLLTDVTNAATKYFKPESIRMLAAGRSESLSILDSLMPYSEVIANFCDGILNLFERGVQTKTCACVGVCDHPPLLDVDAIEGDYAKMQKLLTYIERGATVGEREAAVRRVEEQVGKLYTKVQASLGGRA